MGVDRAAIDSTLAAQARRYEGTLALAAQHLFEAGGKRLRPLISCAWMRALGADPEPHLPAIVASELIHAASLMHDDIVDAAATRRGRPAVHVAFGPHTAVLAGDLLMSHALQLLAASATPALVTLGARAVGDMARGQVMETEHAYRTDVPLERLLTTNRLKTGELFAFAAETGALLAAATPPQHQAARRYGLELGAAFQLSDDVLDWAGRADVTGKPTGLDLAEGKITVPLALALAADPPLAAEVARCWRGGSDVVDQRAAIVRRVRAAGAISAARQLALDHAAAAAAAAAAADGLPRSRWRDHLVALTLRAADRVA